MKMYQVRLLNLVLGIVLWTAHIPGLLLYLLAMHVSLEVLNRQPVYRHSRAKLFNTLFCLYELVLMERLRSTHFHPTAEWLLNSAEHILFAGIISAKIYLYAESFLWKKTIHRTRRIIWATIAFTALGLVNEYVQNIINSRALFTLIPDSVKDIGMNTIGVLVFFGVAISKQRLMQSRHLF